MAKLLLVSHGDLCTGAQSALKMFAGDALDVSAVSLGHDGVDPFRTRLRAEVASTTDEVLIVADLAGGTPCNEATVLGLAEPQRIRVVAGMNLPLLVECAVALMTDDSLDSALEKGVAAGKAGVYPIDLTAGTADEPDDEDDLF